MNFLLFCLINCLALLFLVNINQLMAMNNNYENAFENNSEYIRNLLLIQKRITQQIINALLSDVEEQEINVLLTQFHQIHQQIITYQQIQLNNQELMIRNFYNNIIMIQLEREYLSLIQEIMLAIDNMPIYDASIEQINNLRNIQSRIDQNRIQINIIRNQIQNYRNNNTTIRRRT
ncbi:MAG: hypothetical protein Q8844_01125 [Pigeon pea little leaf phytoplasma]|nr:hypothetical protein [Pigeon pea little leaf phytoplasma]